MFKKRVKPYPPVLWILKYSICENIYSEGVTYAFKPSSDRGYLIKVEEKLFTTKQVLEPELGQYMEIFLPKKYAQFPVWVEKYLE